MNRDLIFKIVILLLILTIIGLTISWLYVENNNRSNFFTKNLFNQFQKSRTSNGLEMTGKLYLTLTPKKENGILIGSNGAIIDLKNNNEIKYLKSDEFNSSPLNFAFSPSMIWTSYLLNNNKGGGSQLKIIRRGLPINQEYVLQEIFTDAKFPTKPSINNKGDIVFSSTERNPGNLASPESSNVYLVTKDSLSPTIVSTGSYPQWIDDENFAILKNNSIQVYNIISKNSFTLLSPQKAGRKVLNNIKYQISNDKTLIALADIDEGKLHLFDLRKEDNQIKSRIIASTNVTGFWPVISADNRFIAMQTVKIDPNTQKFTDVKLNFFNIDRTGVRVSLVKQSREIDLSSFSQEHLFVDYWAK